MIHANHQSLIISPLLLTNYNKTLDIGYVLLYCYNKCKCCSIPHLVFYVSKFMSKFDLLENYAGVSEISRRLNIHPESVRRLIRQGKLPAIKFGNKWLVEKATLDQYASRYDPRPGNKATLL